MIVDFVSRLSARNPAEFSNEEFLLFGELAPSPAAPAEPVTATYAVFDARMLAAGSSRAEAALGRVELSVYPRSMLIEGLSRMEISAGRRQRGAGRRLIQSLAATAPDFQLNIYDIRPPALDFWIALGCSFQPRPGGWDASYILPTSLRPTLPEQCDRAEAMLERKLTAVS
jgi:hypothetical protein